MLQRATTAQPAQPQQGAQGSSQIKVPATQSDLQALGMLREELRSQIRSMTQLRQELTNQVAQGAAVGDDAAVSRIQARIRSLDTRSSALEEQMLQVDDAVRAGIARGVATAPPSEAVTAVPTVAEGLPIFEAPTGMVRGEVLASVVLGMALLFTFVGMLIHRRAWRRAEKHFSTGGSGGRPDVQQLQQAVDVIAVEVERIAEGQRFVSKLLHERLDGASLPAAKERVPVGLQDADVGKGSR